ncbi:MAG: serine/threonine-protein kinase [Fuerstiella sp.]
MSLPGANDETTDAEEVDSSVDETRAETVSFSSHRDTAMQSSFRARPDRIGAFDLQQVVGTGGFGVVFRALDTVLGRTVAVKIPKDEPDDEAKAAFLMEARAVANLDHVGIVPVYDAGEIDGQCYQASAYCSGGNLASLIESGFTFSWKTISEMVEQLALAMHHAHQRGVVHRDLKPANIVIVEPVETEGTVPLLRITDFGLARVLEMQQERSQSSQLVGTPCYMAPEQLSDTTRHNPEASDLYSLGVILYELLSGQKPYEAKSFVGVIDQIRNCSPRAPSSIREDVPADLEIIALKCMSEDPADRYPDCQELALELRRFANGERIQSYRPTITDRVIRWLKSPQRMLEAGGLSMFIGLANPVWIVMVLVAVVVEGLEADMTAEMIPQALFVCFGLAAPLAYFGYQTWIGSRKWLLGGFLFSTVCLCMVIPPLFGNVYVFPGLYERYPLGRIIAYSLLTIEHSIQVTQYALLLLVKRNQFSRRSGSAAS